MSQENLLNGVMRDAETDLTGNISGRFSPEDWAEILKKAGSGLQTRVQEGKSETEAWSEVIREFHREHYWGFHPNYRPPKVKKKKKDLGVSLILFLFVSFTLVKMSVVWLGQIYTFSDEESDTRMFYLALAVVLANVGFFLWRHRRHTD